MTHDLLQREVREETGLDIEPIALSGVYKNMTSAIVNLVFRCKITGGGLVTNDETSDFHWATEAEVPDLMDEAYAIRVLDASTAQAQQPCAHTTACICCSWRPPETTRTQWLQSRHRD